MNVRFEGNNGHDADVTRCLLLTQSGRRYASSAGSTNQTIDNVFATFDDKTTTLIGGTGKYKGITGTVSYTNVELHDTVGGRPALITNHKATWEIK